MNCTKSELEAIRKGLAYKNADEQEKIATSAVLNRIAMNKKKLKFSDLFNRHKTERQIEKQFNHNQGIQKRNISLSEIMQRANEIFNKRNEAE